MLSECHDRGGLFRSHHFGLCFLSQVEQRIACDHRSFECIANKSLHRFCSAYRTNSPCVECEELACYLKEREIEEYISQGVKMFHSILKWNDEKRIQSHQNTCFQFMIMICYLKKTIFAISEPFNDQSGFATRGISLNTMEVFDVISFSLQQKRKFLEVSIVAAPFQNECIIGYLHSTPDCSWNETVKYSRIHFMTTNEKHIDYPLLKHTPINQNTQIDLLIFQNKK